mmetsp:Transcript_28010/g.50459  ORF Transcript_28010/g.50459 Transcript_28010/m.50459 type:complete len:87 (+) Transcript_28010:155-415(+)
MTEAGKGAHGAPFEFSPALVSAMVKEVCGFSPSTVGFLFGWGGLKRCTGSGLVTSRGWHQGGGGAPHPPHVKGPNSLQPASMNIRV